MRRLFTRTTSARVAVLVTLMIGVPYVALAQQQNTAKAECASLGSIYVPIGKYDFAGGTPTFQGPADANNGLGGITFSAGSSVKSGTWTSPDDVPDVWAVFAKDGKDGGVDVIGSKLYTSAMSTDDYLNTEFFSAFSNPDKDISHLTFCGISPDCIETDLKQGTPTKVGGLYEVPLTFTNSQGVKIIEFMSLSNFTVESIDVPHTVDGSNPLKFNIDMGDTGYPEVVVVTLRQVDANNTSASYFAVATSQCASLGDFVVDFDPPYVFPEEAPVDVTLEGNYPNPFNPNTTIRFSLNESASTTLKVYDMLGREVITLVDRELTEGTHTADWDGRDATGQFVPSGVYLYRLISNGTAQTKTMTLLK